MKDDNDLSAPPWRDKSILRRLVVGSGAVLTLVAAGVFLAYPKFERWRETRILGKAREYLDAQSYRSAYLLLEQFVKEKPQNYEARRLYARVLEGSNPADALNEWRSLTKTEPRNPENFSGYAQCALRMGYLDELSQVLETLRSLQPDAIEYYRFSAGLALARGDTAALRQAVEVLAKREPGNATAQYSLAVLRLNSTIPGEVEQARRDLEELARGDAVRIRATLALMRDAPRRWPTEEQTPRLYTRLAAQLKVGVSRFGAARRFMYSAATGQGEPGLQDLIEHMKAQPAPTPADIAALALWMVQAGQAREALVWLETLEESVRRTPAILSAEVACAINLEAWPRLERLLLQNAWGPVPGEAIRLAFEAHALESAHNRSKAESTWSNAMQLAEASLPGLNALQRLAQIWRWPDKQVQVLRVIVRQFPGENWAWRMLTQHALAAGDADRLWQIYSGWAHAAPSNVNVQAERLVVGLLIRPGEAGLARAAGELFQQNPNHPVCRVVRALALWRGGRATEALAVLDEGRLDYAAEPRAALVRGLVLATLGQAAESEHMFAIAAKEKLLLEEENLITQARTHNNKP
jgi:predicted Zn-dependent protease